MNFKINFADKNNEWYKVSGLTGTKDEVIEFVLNKLKSKEYYNSWVYDDKGKRVYCAFRDRYSKEIEVYDYFDDKKKITTIKWSTPNYRKRK